MGRPGHLGGSGVVIWDHETDSRTMIAPGLAAYLERRLASSDD